MTKAVAYYRVSTAKQAVSGLGLDAQRAAVERYCTDAGLTLIAPPFEEAESGKRADRPELLKAIERCRQTGAVLVIAKLDRLSRNAAFLLTLRDSGVRFVAADMPNANELTVGIMALVAEEERKAISRRTREALAAAKARGTRLGNPIGAAAFKGRSDPRVGAQAAQEKADAAAERVRSAVDQIRAEGHASLGAIARELNARSITTPRGATWHASSVRNLLARLEART